MSFLCPNLVQNSPIRVRCGSWKVVMSRELSYNYVY